MKKLNIRTVEVTQYLQPLREGGSLPAIVEGDDGFLYVLKFRGAGQGKKALIAELIGGEIARAIGLNVPELIFMNLDTSFGMTEGDEEIQDLLKFSVGLNLGMSFLSKAITYDPLVSIADPLSSSKVVLLDSIISNIDRTVKNTNLLNWNNELWLIDHGASLFFHHNWDTWKSHIGRTFPMVSQHVLLDRATNIKEAALIIKQNLSNDILASIINSIPDDWLNEEGSTLSAEEKRSAYQSLLLDKLSNLDLLVKEAQDAR